MHTLLTRPARWLRVAGVMALIFAAAATPARAQNVVLNPAIIQGTIEVTGQSFNYATVYANWTDNSTNPPTYYSAGINATINADGTGTYSLIVNVPEGSTPTYSVGAYGYLSGTNQAFYFNAQDVNPDPAVPQTANFIVNPGIIQGTVTSIGAPLNYFYVYAGSESVYSYSPTYTLVVKPGTQINMYGYGYGQNSYAPFSPSSQTVDVGAGQTLTGIDWTINLPAPPPTGSIAGTVTFAGNVTPTYTYVGASGPSSASANIAGGTYSFPDVFAGQYYMYGGVSFADGSSFGFPEAMISTGRYATVSPGATTTVDFTGAQAYVNGAVTISGTNTLADTSSAYFQYSGVYQTPSYGGSAGNYLGTNGAYSFVVSAGNWYPSYLNLTFNKPDPGYLSENLYFYDYQQQSNPVVLSDGDTATRNLTYATGQITVNFQALAGATFSYPQLSFNCSRLDPVTHQTIWSYNGSASNYNLQNVTSGGVTFAGMAGDCTITATAYVNGNNYVTFGSLNATVEPDVTKVVDIGGPSLNVTSPAPNALLSTPNVTVTGFANDEVADILSIMVNGNAATFAKTLAAGRPHEVSFSVSVPLSVGAHSLVTVVTAFDPDPDIADAPGKQASDTRTVFYEPPKSDPIVTATGGTFTYDGAPHAGSGSATGGHGQSLAVTLTYTGTGSTSYGPTSAAPINVGTYQVVAHTDGDADTLAGDSAPAVLTINETVTASYHVCGDGGPYGPKKSGSTIPIKLQVCDQAGNSVSNVVVHATGIQLVSGTQNGTLQDSGNANPGMNFRLVGPPSSYMFNLQTKGFAVGTYNLLFTIGSDPTVRAVAFQISK